MFMRRSSPRSIITALVPAAMFALVGALFVAAPLTGCGPGESADDGTDKQCGDVRSAGKVFNGTLEPTLVPLGENSVLAIGSFEICSGTLIAQRWVLTAKHCGLGAGVSFCMGTAPDNPDSCLTAARVIDHPDADLTLIELSRDAFTVLAQVEPISIVVQDLVGVDGESPWVGRQGEAAGYGQTETGTLGTRYFVAEPIVEVSGEFLTIDGEGKRGVCFGDSGGPLLIIADDGSVRVAGALSNGDETCLGRDRFTRMDVYRPWVESFTGPTPDPVDNSCGSIGREGRCFSDTATWCAADGTLATEACADGSVCGWDNAVAGFRCITEPDPCAGYDSFGACAGNIAFWCEDGVLRQRDCAACGQVCDPVGSVSGAYCAFDNCRGLDYLGQCNGDVAEWCDNGELRRRDCGAIGQTCAFVNDAVGYYCVD